MAQQENALEPRRLTSHADRTLHDLRVEPPLIRMDSFR